MKNGEQEPKGTSNRKSFARRIAERFITKPEVSKPDQSPTQVDDAYLRGQQERREAEQVKIENGDFGGLWNDSLRPAIQILAERGDKAGLEKLRDIIDERADALPNNSMNSTEEDYWTFIYARDEVTEALQHLK
jgi:hypothetical protein